MKKFNTKRFGHLTLLNLCENRNQYLTRAALIFFAYFMVQVVTYLKPMYYGVAGDVTAIAQGLHDKNIGVGFMMSAIMYPIILSWTFAGLETKQKMTAHLMLPATRTEKFALQLLLSFVLWPVVMFVSILAADLVRMFFGLFFPHSFGSSIPRFFSEIHTFFANLSGGMATNRYNEVSNFWGITTTLLFLVLTASAFVLGSSLYRRRAYLMTLLWLFAVWTVIGYITNFFNHNVSFHLDYSDINVILIVVSIIELALTVLCAYFTCRVYKSFQIIPRRLFTIKKLFRK